MAYKLRAQNVANVWLIPFFTRKPATLAQRPDSWFFLRQVSGDRPNVSSTSTRKSPRTPTMIRE